VQIYAVAMRVSRHHSESSVTRPLAAGTDTPQRLCTYKLHGILHTAGAAQGTRSFRWVGGALHNSCTSRTDQ